VAFEVSKSLSEGCVPLLIVTSSRRGRGGTLLRTMAPCISWGVTVPVLETVRGFLSSSSKIAPRGAYGPGRKALSAVMWTFPWECPPSSNSNLFIYLFNKRRRADIQKLSGAMLTFASDPDFPSSGSICLELDYLATAP